MNRKYLNLVLIKVSIILLVSCKSNICNENKITNDDVSFYMCSYLKKEKEPVIFLRENIFSFNPNSSKKSIIDRLIGQEAFDIQLEYVSGFLEYIENKNYCFEDDDLIELDLPYYDILPLPGEENIKYIGNSENRILPNDCSPDGASINNR